MILSATTLAVAFIVDLTRSSLPIKKFEVVDKYKQCDVIRYTTPSGDWQYFLDCLNKPDMP